MKTIKLFTIFLSVAFLFYFSMVGDAGSTAINPTIAPYDNLNREGANYTPPAAATFPDGPTSVISGESTQLYAGPAPGQAGTESLLFLLSIPDSTLGSGMISFELITTRSTPITITQEFYVGDFYTTDQWDFPDSPSEGGLNNGEIFGVNFYDTVHAGLLVDFESPPFKEPGTPWPTGTKLGDVTITTPIAPLRVDIFNVAEQSDPLIVGRTANSGSLAVVPEPATMLLLGSGLIGFAVVGRRKFFKKK
jgi:hypothetical protein